jgi:hypothetical protein
MDDFVRTVGERSLAKLYDEATNLIAKGSLMKNVTQLKSVLTAMDLVLEPLSHANIDYRKARSAIMKELKDAQDKDGKKGIIEPAPAIYTVLTDWFRHLNYVIDDNNLLFTSSMVFQENDPDKWRGDEDDKTPL